MKDVLHLQKEAERGFSGDRLGASFGWLQNLENDAITVSRRAEGLRPEQLRAFAKQIRKTAKIVYETSGEDYSGNHRTEKLKGQYERVLAHADEFDPALINDGREYHGFKRSLERTAERYVDLTKTRKMQARLGAQGYSRERYRAGVAAIGIIGGISLLSTSITGNVIGNATVVSSSILGAALLIVGLTAGFFWVQGRKGK